MKKICILFLMLVFMCSVTSGCAEKKKKPNMIQAQRRFSKYITNEQPGTKNVIDLSEGPKLNYDADFGPKRINFDLKIVDPY